MAPKPTSIIAHVERLGHGKQLSEQSMFLVADACGDVERVRVNTGSARSEPQGPQIGHVEWVAIHCQQTQRSPVRIEDVDKAVFVGEIANEDIAAKAVKTAWRLRDAPGR